MRNENGGEGGQQGSQQRQRRCFLEWIELQKRELDELLEALSLLNNNSNSNNNSSISNNGPVRSDDVYSRLIEKCMSHYREYIDKRTRLAKDDVSHFFAPNWNTALENSLLWIAGCRPSLCIRLVYALCGSQIDSQLESILQGGPVTIPNDGNTVAEMSCSQLFMITDLHRKIFQEEERLAAKLASLQEEIADQPIAVIARQARRVGEPSREVDEAFTNHEKAMQEIMKQADELRLSTIKELTSILNPRQAVDLLAAGKKLHLCVHAWGKERHNSPQASTSNNTTP